MTSLSKRAAAALRSLADAVERTAPTTEVMYRTEFANLRTVTKEALKADLDVVLGQTTTAIYALKLGSRDGCDAVWEAMEAARKQGVDGRKYSRLLPFVPSEYLYVGSSKDVSKRLLEHFGFGSKATYSLHLAAWACGLPSSIEVRVMKYERVDPQVLCALEDQLAKELKPMFGRRGSL